MTNFGLLSNEISFLELFSKTLSKLFGLKMFPVAWEVIFSLSGHQGDSAS